MKTAIRTSFFITIVILVVTNLSIFTSSIVLGEKISYYEIESKRIHQENIELEKKANQVSSYERIASEAASLKFVKQVQPMYIHSLKVAQRQ